MPAALITGITGQDGSYLTELLLQRGYVVHGIVRRASTIERARLDHLTLDAEVYGKSLFLHYADLDDVTTIRRILMKAQPDEFYHLAGQSHVGLSFEIPETTCEFTAMGTLRLLEIIRDMDKRPKFLNIGSSEIFGRPDQAPQSEQSPVRPVTPYGVAKAFAVQMVRVYRESFEMFACSAICYNHESPRRGPSFVTRKITRAAARIKLGLQDKLPLGNLDARRDWGYAKDYVEAMTLMLQRDEAEDFVLATGESHSVQEFLNLAFEHVGLDWHDHVELDPRFIRPNEVNLLVGDSSKAREKLGWAPTTDVGELARIMVESDMAFARREAVTKSAN
jgi:GDPmannose 4,6-dehydratase